MQSTQQYLHDRLSSQSHYNLYKFCLKLAFKVLNIFEIQGAYYITSFILEDRHVDRALELQRCN